MKDGSARHHSRVTSSVRSRSAEGGGRRGPAAVGTTHSILNHHPTTDTHHAPLTGARRTRRRCLDGSLDGHHDSTPPARFLAAAGKGEDTREVQLHFGREARREFQGSCQRRRLKLDPNRSLGQSERTHAGTGSAHASSRVKKSGMNERCNLEGAGTLGDWGSSRICVRAAKAPTRQ